MKSLYSLYLHKYRVELKPREQISLPPYKGSTFRGVFGHALKRVICISKHRNCDDCIVRLRCVYSAIMETPIPEDHPHHGKYRNAPHPYVIIPPLTKRRHFHPEDSISFEFVLVGKANEFLPYFIYTFTEMGKTGIGIKRGRFQIASVQALDIEGWQSEIFNGNTGQLQSSANKIDFTYFLNEGFEGNEITLSFETPVRIKEQHTLSANSDLPFGLLIKRLSERASLLAHFHCGTDLEDIDGFIKDSENVAVKKSNLRWEDWERYSNRQQTKMKFGGMIGEITYQGQIATYLPLLRIGEHIHVGKLTTFGLGKYRIRHGGGTLPESMHA